jgi:subtilisin-like proprotein convertase family protein
MSNASRFPLVAGLLVVGAALIVPTTVEAKRAPDRSQLSASLRALSSPVAEFEASSKPAMAGGIQRQYGADSGLLRRYWLRNPSSVAAGSGSPKAIAEQFLTAHAGELGLSAGAIGSELDLAYEKESPSGTHLRWNQEVNGVPVWRSEIVVKVDQAGRVTSVQNNLRPNVKIPTSPTLAAETALSIAKTLLAPTGEDLGEHRADLRIVETRDGARLVWMVQMPVSAPMGDWLVFVDAKSGEVLGLEDRMVYATGTGRVFDPDPMSKLADSTLVDGGDANNVGLSAYDTRTLQDITLSAGIYSLNGPFARLIDNEAPTFAPVTSANPDSFQFQRSDQAFEDVNTYFQIDFSQRYIQSLGFLNVNNRVQQIDSHGLSGADNSHYVPSTGNIAFGEGGIDDAEDADVIWHEYGHSIQDNIVPGWGGGQEGAMGEGFGDYWGGSYSRSLYPNFQPMHFFTWDGNGETWDGRPLIDTSKHYPEDCCGGVHASGTLWCSGLTDCWNTLGRTVMDRLVLDHHFALGTSATMADAANQIIQSDIDLYGGAHLSTLVAKFDFWGFVDAEDFVPTIVHAPLTDLEDVAGPYPVVAVVTSTQPLTASSPELYWGHGAAITNSVTMTPTANPNEYTADIPGPGADSDVRYYIRAEDTQGGIAFDPTTAPASPHVFHVGADVTPPVIAHTPIALAPEISWPLNVTANVTDNLGVDTGSVVVDWTLNAVPKTAFTLARVGSTDTYTGAFPSTQAEVAPGDVVTYHLSAADVATVPNTARHPASGEHSFTISEALGTVLVLDDDDLAKRVPETKTVVDEKDASIRTTLASAGEIGIQSSSLISGWLNAMGFVASVEAAATSDPASWPGYSFIVSSSGGNIGPLANAAYRAAIEAHVAAGHKLLVEGGEVGYDAISSPGYPTFAANVLHGNTWAADDAGALQKLAPQATHPLANQPNVLPSTIPITYTGFGSNDSYKPTPPAYAVYGVTAQAGNVGLSVFDDNVAPQSAQIVVFAFDLKDVTDTTVARGMLENAAHFLVAPEPPPNSTIEGRVALGTSWGGSGIQVTLQPGGASTTTDPDGMFSLPGLYAGTYSIAATFPGYNGTPRIVTVAQDGTVSLGLQLYPAAEANACNDPALAIPDNTPAGVSDDIVIVPAFTVATVQASVNITHTYRGDLIVELRHDATNVRLHNRTGGTAEDIVGTYPTTLAVNGPGSLSDFNGQSSAGTWTLFLSDNANVDVGTLNQWCVILSGIADTTQTVDVGPGTQPAVLALAPVFPNPTRDGSAALSLSLPAPGHTKIGIYDVLGRHVRTVVDQSLTAGPHVISWDGRDDDGGVMHAGVYVVRMTTAQGTLTRRFVIAP